MKIRATIEDLYNVPENGKAEIVNGELVLMSPTGDLPSSAAGAIYASLRQYQRNVGGGRAYADNIGLPLICPIGSRSALTRPSTWASGRAGSFLQVLQYSRPRSEAKGITTARPSKRWQQNGRTISRQAHLWCGM